MYDVEECLLCMMEEVPANWIPVKIWCSLIDFPKRVVQCGKTEDRSVGVDTITGRKIGFTALLTRVKS